MHQCRVEENNIHDLWNQKQKRSQPFPCLCRGQGWSCCGGLPAGAADEILEKKLNKLGRMMEEVIKLKKE